MQFVCCRGSFFLLKNPMIYRTRMNQYQELQDCSFLQRDGWRYGHQRQPNPGPCWSLAEMSPVLSVWWYDLLFGFRLKQYEAMNGWVSLSATIIAGDLTHGGPPKIGQSWLSDPQRSSWWTQGAPRPKECFDLESNTWSSLPQNLGRRIWPWSMSCWTRTCKNPMIGLRRSRFFCPRNVIVYDSMYMYIYIHILRIQCHYVYLYNILLRH